MKKALLLSLFIILCLCSCKSEKPKAPLQNTTLPFFCTANIKVGESNFSANLSFVNSANATLEFTSPAELDSLIFRLENGEITADYKGLVFTLPQNDSAHYNAAKLIFSSLSSPHKNSVLNQSGDYEASDSIQGIDYMLIWDSKSGNLKALKSSALNLLVNFENFTFSR